MELKPCPFCGEHKNLNLTIGSPHYPTMNWQIKCKNCFVSSGWFGTKDEAIEAWNERVDKNRYLDQIFWERDIAMSQLEEHGIPFGGIAPDVLKVVRCKDCEYWNRNNISCEGLAKCVTGESGIRYRNKNDFCSRGKQYEQKIN